MSYLIVGALGLTALLNWEKLSSSHKGGLGIAVAIWVATLFLLNFQEAWLGLAFVALLSAAIGFMRNQQIRLSLLLSIIALCLTLVGPWIPSFVTPQLEIRPDIGSTLEPARQVLTSKRALVGTGPGTFGYAFAQHRSDTLNITDFWNVGFSQGSSFALTALTTLGVLGVLAWLFLYVAFFKRIRTHMGDPIVAGAALFAAFTGIALLVYVGFFVQLIFGAIALGIMSSLTGARKEISFKSNASWRLLIGFLALVIASAVTLAGAYFLGQKYIAAAYTGSGVRALSAGESDRAIEQLNIANRLDTSDISLRFISQALMTKFQELVASASSEDDGQQAQSLISLAVETATNATTINPADSANWSNLASIYESLTPLVEGTGDLALDAYSEAEKRDPQGPQWALAKARTLGAQASFLERNEEEVGDIYERAQTEIERALTLKQNYTAARFLSAQLSFRSGNVDRAIERAAEIRQQNPFDPGVALQIGLLYYQNDQLAEARTEFLRAISLDANFANARYFLGLTESRLGDNDKALSEFRWIAERNPDNEEVKKIIANLENGRAPLEGVAQPLESSETPVPEESQ